MFMEVYSLFYWMQPLAEIFYEVKAFGFVVGSGIVVLQHFRVPAFDTGFSLPVQL